MDILPMLRKSRLLAIARSLRAFVMGRFALGLFVTRYRLMEASAKRKRMLEIGTSGRRIPGFESLSIVPGRDVDYVLDASKSLPFCSNTFHVIYASHVLEHIAWYRIPDVLAEWVRVLCRGGVLEIFVPDGLKICDALRRYEAAKCYRQVPDGWIRRNPAKNPCVWASGRIYYGDAGPGSWHRALFTPRYLGKVMKGAGLCNVRRMRASEVRGVDHGWVNLGVRGMKP